MPDAQESPSDDLGIFCLWARTTGDSRAMTAAVAVSAAPWTPLHSLAERLCYWPTFLEEWNSDCGQKRREDGIGPEEPLRWAARPESAKAQ